jgi:hypothetical protein
MATGDTYGDLGTTLKVASGAPASEDQSGYGLLTWGLIGGVLSLPQRGDSAEDVSEPTLADGRVEHFVGQLDGGVLEIPIKFIEGDTGQTTLTNAAAGNAEYSFQEVDPDGEAHFYYGRVMSLQRRASSPSTFKAWILRVAVNSTRFTGTEES